MINEEVRTSVEFELRPGERILWADKPRKFPLVFMTLYMTGFSFVWTAIAICFFGIGAITSIFGTSTDEANLEGAGSAAFGVAFSAISLLFVAIGVFMCVWGLKMLIGPSKEVYAVTNQRGIIISPFFKYRVASLSPEVLKNSERKGNLDLGTLTFTSKGNGSMAMWMNSYQTELNAFQNIQNPKRVEDLIYKTLEGSNS